MAEQEGLKPVSEPGSIMNVEKMDPGSFRDPSGFVFSRDEVIYRQVNTVHQPHYDYLMATGLYEELVEAELLISHTEVPEHPLDPTNAYKVILPERIPFISYPYEWSFEQLRDAALTMLAVQKASLEKGMSLRDASAYNIQFHRGKPILIDTLSFERLREGRPWTAYGQFCRHFLAPLALMSYRDVRLGQLLRAYIDGVPLDLAVPQLPLRARFRIPLLLHLFIQLRSQKKYASMDPTDRARSGDFSLKSFRGLLDSLTSAIEMLRPHKGPTHWLDYDRGSNSYGVAGVEGKKAIVAGFIRGLKPATVWDLGANTGLFSRISSDLGIHTVSLDADPGCVDETYKRMKADGAQELLPLVCDLTNPSPASGWGGTERKSLEQRGPADLVMALALIHHLAIGNNVPLDRIADLFARLGRNLIIEFISKDDENVRRLLAGRDDIFEVYSRGSFEETFSRHFSIQTVTELADSGRVLYLMRAR